MCVTLCLSSMYVGVIAWVHGRDMCMRLQFFVYPIQYYSFHIVFFVLFIPCYFFLFGNFC